MRPTKGNFETHGGKYETHALNGFSLGEYWGQTLRIANREVSQHEGKEKSKEKGREKSKEKILGDIGRSWRAVAYELGGDRPCKSPLVKNVHTGFAIASKMCEEPSFEFRSTAGAPVCALGAAMQLGFVV